MMTACGSRTTMIWLDQQKLTFSISFGWWNSWSSLGLLSHSLFDIWFLSCVLGLGHTLGFLISDSLFYQLRCSGLLGLLLSSNLQNHGVRALNDLSLSPRPLPPLKRSPLTASLSSLATSWCDKHRVCLDQSVDSIASITHTVIIIGHCCRRYKRCQEAKKLVFKKKKEKDVLIPWRKDLSRQFLTRANPSLEIKLDLILKEWMDVSWYFLFLYCIWHV